MGKSRISLHTEERDTRFYSIIEKQAQEYINMTGIECLYIATQSGDKGRDPIYREERDEKAIQIFDNVKLNTDDGIPIIGNESTKFDYLSWLQTGTYHLSKKDFKELTIERNKFFSVLNGEYVPRPGDIVIMKIAHYFPIFEITGIDDEHHHTIDQRLFWEVKLQTITNRMIDYSNIKPELVKLIREFVYNEETKNIIFNKDKEVNVDNIINSLDNEIKDNVDWSEKIETTLSINDTIKDDERNINEPNVGEEQYNYPFGVF